MKLFFSDYFDLKRDVVESYGAVDVSLISDIPLFIDPFLIFHSEKSEYKKLHSQIIDYLFFLKSKAGDDLGVGELTAWFKFSEVRQNWLGYSSENNEGRGLWLDFARKLNRNLGDILPGFGQEKITASPHLEKLCLIEKGVGRDGISDFTTNLIKGYLLEYTQKFAITYLKPEQITETAVDRAVFNRSLSKWMPSSYKLPKFKRDFVLLTPEDILTKKDVWINKNDLSERLYFLPNAVENEQLRAEINNYLRSLLTAGSTDKEYKDAVRKAVIKYPILMDVYIKQQEESGDDAVIISKAEVGDVKLMFNIGAKKAVNFLEKLNFYSLPENSFSEALEKIAVLKKFIETDGYKLFYSENGKIISEREEDLDLLYRLIWRADKLRRADLNPQTDHGRGPVDFAVSIGANDKTLVEFKVGSNTKLKKNLLKQLDTYREADTANNNSRKIYTITYFTDEDEKRVKKMLQELKLNNKDWVVLIDARRNNKPSGSNA
jgi:hypothetical protein